MGRKKFIGKRYWVIAHPKVIIDVRRYAKENGLNWRKINWRALKALSFEHGYDVKKIFDANYGQVNIYHIDVFNMYLSH